MESRSIIKNIMNDIKIADQRPFVERVITLGPSKEELLKKIKKLQKQIKKEQYKQNCSMDLINKWQTRIFELEELILIDV